MYLEESDRKPKLFASQIRQFNIVYAICPYPNRRILPHYCVVLKKLTNDQLLVQMMTTSESWESDKVHVLADQSVLPLSDESKTSKLLIDNTLKSEETLEKAKSYALRKIPIRNLRKSEIWHLSDEDLDFLKRFYADKGIKLERERVVFVTERELAAFGLKLIPEEDG